MDKEVNERKTIKGDIKEDINFPSIPNDTRLFLLIYEASQELNNAGVKGEIIKFLISKSILNKDIMFYINSSIYFKYKVGDVEGFLKHLNYSFKIHFDKFKKDHSGEIFWVFNCISRKDLMIDHSMTMCIGEGNATLNKDRESKL